MFDSEVTEFPHVIQDGRVYLGADAVAAVFASGSRVLALKALLTLDTETAFIAEGIGLAADFVSQVNDDILNGIVVSSLKD